MRRELTPEQKAAIAAKAAQRAAERQQKRQKAIVIDQKTRVFRFDELNWALDHAGTISYYSTCADALRGALHRKIDERVQTSLASVLEAVRAAERAAVASVQQDAP